jgi:hypothetical protein
MHQDLYGEIFFPIQMTIMLSQLEADFSGGEFLLMEQRPRAQSRGEAITLDHGEAIIFATRWRPVRGARGYYRVNVRHGVSRLKSGLRFYPRHHFSRRQVTRTAFETRQRSHRHQIRGKLPKIIFDGNFYRESMTL